MCMTLVLSEPMTRAVVSAACRLEWTNFTECVVTYVVTRTNMRFSGVISTAVLHYVEVRPETRLSVYVPQLCLALVVLLVNGWLLVSLQGSGGVGGSVGGSRANRNRPIALLLLSLSAAYGLQGAVNVYTMTSLVAASMSPNPLYRNQATECLVANSFLIASILAALFHHAALAADRFHSAFRPMSYRTFWTRLRVYCLVAALWLSAFVLAFLPLLGWRPKFAYCIFFYQYPRGYLILLTTVFAVTVSATAGQYAYVVLNASATKRRRGASAGTFAVSKSWNRHRRKRDARLTSTVAILGVLGTVLWTPMFMHLSLACPQCLARSDNDFILLGVFAFALTNALLGPLVYAFRLKQLRHLMNDVVKQWGLCRGIKRRSGSFELRAGEAGERPGEAQRWRGRPLHHLQARVSTIDGSATGGRLSRGPNVMEASSKCSTLGSGSNGNHRVASPSPSVVHPSQSTVNGDFLY